MIFFFFLRYQSLNREMHASLLVLTWIVHYPHNGMYILEWRMHSSGAMVILITLLVLVGLSTITV